MSRLDDTKERVVVNFSFTNANCPVCERDLCKDRGKVTSGGHLLINDSSISGIDTCILQACSEHFDDCKFVESPQPRVGCKGLWEPKFGLALRAWCDNDHFHMIPIPLNCRGYNAEETN